MAISATEFLATANERDKDLSRNTQCCSCHKPIQTAITGCNKTGDGFKCDDCYFDDLGDLIEKHPIGR
jgi:hypothetical protein